MMDLFWGEVCSKPDVKLMEKYCKVIINSGSSDNLAS